MSKFKNGDRVRLADGAGMVADKGAEASVTEASGRYVRVVWDTTVAGHNDQRDGFYYSEKFELVQAAPTPIPAENIRALVEGDVVLVEATVSSPVDSDGDIYLAFEYSGRDEVAHYAGADQIRSLVKAAPRSIAAGMQVTILGHTEGLVIGPVSDGRWAVEFATERGASVQPYDASALEPLF